MPIFVQCHSDRIPSSMKCRQFQQELLVCKIGGRSHISLVVKGAVNPQLLTRLADSPSPDIKKYTGICQSTINSVIIIIPQRRLVIRLVEAGDSLIFVLISIEDGN